MTVVWSTFEMMEEEKRYIITEKLTSEIEEHIKNLPECVSLRIPSVIRSHPYTPTPIKFPNSTELLAMANTEWKHRIERKHTHEAIPWVDGWIHGYLIPKPEFKRDEKYIEGIGKKEREKLIEEILKFDTPKFEQSLEESGWNYCMYKIKSLRKGAP